MPPQLEIPARPDEEVIQFHDQICVFATEKLAGGTDDGVVEIGCSEDIAGWHVRVKEMLDPPDPVRGVGGPGRELFGEGAEVGPFSGLGEESGVVAGGAEGGEICGGED